MRLGTLVNGQFKIPAGATRPRREGRDDDERRRHAAVDAARTRTCGARAGSTRPPIRTADSEVLLSVPKYDFNWQTEYVFAEPLKLPKGTTIRAVAHYDNSAGNKDNPDPSSRCRVGRSDVGGDDVHGVRLLHRRRRSRHRRHAAVHARRTVAPAFGRTASRRDTRSQGPGDRSSPGPFLLVGTLRRSSPTIASPRRSPGIAKSPRSSRRAARAATRPADRRRFR